MFRLGFFFFLVYFCILPLAVNMRAPYEFRLFRGYSPGEETAVDEDRQPLPNSKTLLAVSPVVEFLNYNEPTQVHISLTSLPDQMSVMFVTKDPIGASVRYGKASDKLDLNGSAQSRTYKQKDMCDAPANSALGWRDPGYIHSAVMVELNPGERYFYQASPSPVFLQNSPWPRNLSSSVNKDLQ